MFMRSLKYAFFTSILTALICSYYLNKLMQYPQIDDISVSYWGPGRGKPDDETIRPFIINVTESELKALEDKLDKTRPLTPPLEGIGFEYGINTNYLNKLVRFWKKEYKWKEREVFLNKYPQFKTQIGGLNIHYIHVKPDANLAKGKTVVPVLVLHGWPGSVREFYELIPLLTTPQKGEDFVFEVVAPSLPGYAFSEAAAKPGMAPAHMGALFHQLMIRLGHSQYYIQGGDWGSVIGHAMAVLYPDKILGYHSNMCMATTVKSRIKMFLAYMFPSFFVDPEMIESFQNQFSDIFFLESGYFHIQATKPDTVGVALTDSPVGLAAYFLEKFSTWTNKSWRSREDGGLEYFDKADLLDNIMIHWLAKSITTSMRLYSEAYSNTYRNNGINLNPVPVPSGCIRFANELIYVPTSALHDTFNNLVSITDQPKGGHFPAFEVPDVLAQDVWNFVRLVRSKVKPQRK